MLDDRARHLVAYLLFLSLVNYRASVGLDKLKLAGALFLAAKILQARNLAVDDLAREFRLRPEDVKATALELFTFLGSEEKEEKMTAVKRMFNHSQFGYISTIKLTFKLN